MRIVLRRTSAFFLTGIACLALSLGLFIAVFQNWVFPGLPTGNWIMRESAVTSMYICLLSIVLGIAGGFLIGKYHEDIE